MQHPLRFHTLFLVLAILGFISPASAQIQLNNGIPLGGFASAAGGEIHFVLAVPGDADSISIQTTCGDPDADIYARWGAPASASVFTYKSDGPSSNESITIQNPPGGNLYIMVKAHTSFVGLGILGEYFGADDIVVYELDNGQVVDHIDGFTGDSVYFKVSVPFGQDYVAVDLWGMDPDADLYVRWGDLPTTSQYLAKSTGSSSNESIVLDNPPSGDLYILVHAYSTFFNAVISAEWDGASGGSVVELESGVKSDKFGGGQDSFRLFAIDVPVDTALVTFSMFGGTGDADLYVRFDGIPTLDTFDYTEYADGNNELISVAWPEQGVAYLLVHGYDDYAGVRVKATVHTWTYFSHFAGPWKNDKIGTSSTKLKNDGSALASLSMALSYAGADVNPGTLNQWLKTHNGFSGPSTVNWPSAAEFDGAGGLEFVGTGKISTIANLRLSLDLGRIVLARSTRFGTDTHWVVILYYTGSGNSWSKFRYWDPSDGLPVTRKVGDGWVGANSKTRVYGVAD